MVKKIKNIIATFVFITILGYETVSKWKWLQGVRKSLDAARLRNKTKVLSVLLGVHLIHTTTHEGTRKGLKESGKLRSSLLTEMGSQNVSEVFLLIPNLFFSLNLTIGTLNVVSAFMTYGQLLSIAPYVKMYINVFTVLAYTEIFLKVAFLLQRKNNTLV